MSLFLESCLLFSPVDALLSLGRESYSVTFIWVSLVAQMVKNLPTMWETRVQSLGREDPLEEERAARSSILAWRTPWTEDPGSLQSMGLQRVRLH